MASFIEQRNLSSAFKWGLRIWIHSGPVVAGVVGKHKYAFDFWGDTVNVASWMESAGIVGRVNISAYTFDLVKGRFECEYRGKVDAKGKGLIDMYLVTAGKKAIKSVKTRSAKASAKKPIKKLTSKAAAAPPPRPAVRPTTPIKPFCWRTATPPSRQNRTDSTACLLLARAGFAARNDTSRH